MARVVEGTEEAVAVDVTEREAGEIVVKGGEGEIEGIVVKG